MGQLSRADWKRGFVGRGWTAFLLIMVMFVLPGCHRKAREGEAASGQNTFASPDDAATALAGAARSGDQQQLLAIFGPDSKDLLYSGNAAEDKASLQGFVAAFDQMHRWRNLDSGKELLLVGASNTAFPIPLTQERGGKWYFDTAAGRDELLARRVGRNEVAAMDVLATLADAQNEYYAQAHDGTKQYARKFISDPGKQNGLYWPQEPGKPKSPIGPLVAYASEQGAKVNSSLHKPFHGYYFGILDSQGYSAVGGLRDYVRSEQMTRGFGIIAWPADYGRSGVMTFIIDRDRLIYQRDLGKTTMDQAPFMTQYNPDGNWRQVKD
jgi:hypothetical protein